MVQKKKFFSWVALVGTGFVSLVGYTNCSRFSGLPGVASLGSTSLSPFSSNGSGGGPRLEDYFAGRAHFQPLAQTDLIRMERAPGVDLDETSRARVSIFKDPASGNYFGFARTAVGDRFERHNVILIKSVDSGLSFTAVGQITPTTATRSFLDQHLTVDESVSPPLYTLVMECGDSAHLDQFSSSCVTQSTTPTDPASWPPPRMLIQGSCSAGDGQGTCVARATSASTPTLLLDGASKYVAWASVDLPNSNFNLTFNRVYSSSARIDNLDSFSGASTMPGVQLDSEANSHCQSSWDCNNRSTVDWVKEGDWYYLLYNGANFNGCRRPLGDTTPNVWGLGLTRSQNALGVYPSAPSPFVTARNEVECGASYGTIVKIDGNIYVYYSDRAVAPAGSAHGVTELRRTKLVWNDDGQATPTVAPVSTRTMTPSQNILMNLYADILKRSVTAESLETLKTLTCAKVGEWVALSPEAKGVYDTKPSDEEFLGFIYPALLGRAVDSSGLANWVSQFKTNPQQWDRAKFIQYLLTTDEYKKTCTARGLAADGPANAVTSVPSAQPPVPTPAQSSPAQTLTAGQLFATKLYRSILGRSISAGELEFSPYPSGTCAIIGQTVAFSGEAKGIYSAQSDAAFVSLIYLGLLQREVDASGLATWVNELQNNSAVWSRDSFITYVLTLPEYQGVCSRNGL